jgi:3-phenylpropionate/trans-cinnamate dioxygenase ferredoxin reductase subunit
MAGAQTAMALRRHGYVDRIVVVCDEHDRPYHRPPLSKEYLKSVSSANEETLWLRPDQFWQDKHVELILGTAAIDIDRQRKRVELADGTAVTYDHLVLATGARNRRLPGEPAMTGVLDLRTIEHARSLRQRLQPGTSLVVVGGGFIGLEVAAAARAHDVEVTVVEALDRVMARVLSPEMSKFFAALHETNGVRILTNRVVRQLVGDVDVDGVVLDDGERIPATTVLIAVGISPNLELASRSGLEVGDGVVVDHHLLTSDASISAIGDCAYYPCTVSRRTHRLESIQNATDQAQYVAKRLTGEPGAYSAVPWFWTEQHGCKLQIAGVAGADATSVLRGAPGEGGFSVCRIDGNRLVAVESVDHAVDHIAARKLLGSDFARDVSAELLADTARPLKALISR